MLFVVHGGLGTNSLPESEGPISSLAEQWDEGEMDECESRTVPSSLKVDCGRRGCHLANTDVPRADCSKLLCLPRVSLEANSRAKAGPV